MHDVWIHMHVFIIAIPIELRKYLKSIYLLQGAFSKINIVWVCILKMILWNLMVCNMQPWDEVMHLIMFFSCNLTRNELASMVSNFAPQAGMQEAFSKINSLSLHLKNDYMKSLVCNMQPGLRWGHASNHEQSYQKWISQHRVKLCTTSRKQPFLKKTGSPAYIQQYDVI